VKALPALALSPKGSVTHVAFRRAGLTNYLVAVAIGFTGGLLTQRIQTAKAEHI
jgi:hypothetical protein